MTSKNHISRRKFITWAGVTGAALMLAGCKPTPIATAAATPLPTLTHLPVGKTATVATASVKDYTLEPLTDHLRRMLDDLGGLSQVVKPGDVVGIKVNLTGGTYWDAPDKLPAIETFATHPAVLAALAASLHDAGVERITVLESTDDPTLLTAWGYAEVLKQYNLTWVNLNHPDPYPDFAVLPVGGNAAVFDTFTVNPILAELDCFISLAKMKCHATAGVTHSMKNLFGLAPVSLYRNAPQDGNRTMFHTWEAFDPRIAHIIVDLNLARPIDLALVDGIKTVEGAEGPWNAAMTPISPGVLVAGADAVAVDAVCTGIMGFDPTASGHTSPFLHSENHLNLAAEAGLGTNRLENIVVKGAGIDDLKTPFKPAA